LQFLRIGSSQSQTRPLNFAAACAASKFAGRTRIARAM
jgi:hypothetical protein